VKDYCPYCASRGCTLYKESQPYRDQPTKTVAFFKCSTCGTIYPNPRLDFSEIHEYLQQSDRAIEIKNVPEYHISWYDFSLRILKRYKKKYSLTTAFDIGANNGEFCRLLNYLGISAFGIEPQGTLVNIARGRGLSVYTGTFPDQIPLNLGESSYDLVSVNEVLYYFPDLKNSLKKIHDLLSDGGILFIKSYNGENDYRRYSKSFFTRPGDYVQAFPTIDTIRFWVEDSGFEIIEILAFPDDYLSIIFGIDPMKFGIFQRLFNMLYGNLFMNNDEWLNRVDRMIIIAKKRDKPGL
jgi:SAM-dependent methyltransferase